MAGLDQASLRRFDMKLEFRALNTKQPFKLFKAESKILGILFEDKKQVVKKIGSMRGLTPGDFAAVRRQSRFQPIESVEAFIDRLAEELAVKEQNRDVKMGFL